MKVNKEGLTIIRKYSGKKTTLKDLDPAINTVLSFDKDYDFNVNEFSALVSMVYSGVNLNELTNNTRRSKYQISNKIGIYTFDEIDGEFRFNEILKDRRKEEYDLFVKEVETDES